MWARAPARVAVARAAGVTASELVLPSSRFLATQFALLANCWAHLYWKYTSAAILPVVRASLHSSRRTNM